MLRPCRLTVMSLSPDLSQVTSFLENVMIVLPASSMADISLTSSDLSISGTLSDSEYMS